MLGRKRTGSVVCRSCGRLVGVGEGRCPHCGAASPSLWGFAPLVRRLGQDLGFTQLVMVGCASLYLATLLFDPAGIRAGGLMTFLAPSLKSVVHFGASGTLPVVVLGRWWTLLSAGWLHGSLLHIAFNLMWIRQLAPVTAELYGPSRAVILYTAGSVGGFALSSYAPPLPILGGGAFTLGASAPIFGLFGALIFYGRRGGASQLSQQIWVWAVALFLLGVFWPGGGVDNWAHLGGFGGGYLAAMALDPLRPERLNHMLTAVACLAATALAVLASLLTPLPS